jgi:poly [ADP-ribose] polymerase
MIVLIDCDIFVDHDDAYGYTPYNVMMNVSDVSKGTNKFYQIQLLNSKTAQRYFLYKRWGRVGVDDIGKREREREREKEKKN